MNSSGKEHINSRQLSVFELKETFQRVARLYAYQEDKTALNAVRTAFRGILIDQYGYSGLEAMEFLGNITKEGQNE